MGWVVNATPRPLYARERPGAHCIGGWVGPRAGLDRCGKCHSHRDSISERSTQYNDVNNQQDETNFSFINLLNSALHVPGDKLYHIRSTF